MSAPYEYADKKKEQRYLEFKEFMERLREEEHDTNQNFFDSITDSIEG